MKGRGDYRAGHGFYNTSFALDFLLETINKVRQHNERQVKAFQVSYQRRHPKQSELEKNEHQYDQSKPKRKHPRP